MNILIFIIFKGMVQVSNGGYVIHPQGYLRTPSGLSDPGREKEKATSLTKGQYLTLITGKGNHTKDPSKLEIKEF